MIRGTQKSIAECINYLQNVAGYVKMVTWMDQIPEIIKHAGCKGQYI